MYTAFLDDSEIISFDEYTTFCGLKPNVKYLAYYDRNI